ncbi:hypothetical protein G6514_004489 [Epicoccum nigrum]|nr:hypothetical protein G6514_004489 [Epicoccum nigrum]
MADSEAQDNLNKAVDTPTDTPASKAVAPAAVAAPTTAPADGTAPSELPQHVTGATPNRFEHPTNKAEWLNSHYLNEDHSLTVDAYTKVTVTGGGDAWWRGSHINWALELVRNRYYEHEDVGIAIPHWCNMMYLAETVPDYLPTDKEDQAYRVAWGPMITDLGNKDIIILPVNDGYRGAAATYAVYTAALELANIAKEEVRKAQEEVERTDKEARKSHKKAKKADQEEVDKEEADKQEVDKEAREAQKAVNEARETLRKAKADEKKAKEAQQYSQTAGAHWSFIVVDRRDRNHPRAHYVDGMVVPRRRSNGRWAITNIEINGRIAGQVLRGFDRVFELPEQGFEAHTLKFVPNMSRDNAYRDNGPCGPHLYAFLDHILGRKTTLIDPGLHTTFDDQSLRSLRAREFNFNSRTTRERFTEELLAERKKYEERRPDLAVANLTREVLNDLTTVNGLIDLVKFVKKAPSSKSGTKGVRPQGNAGGSNKHKDDDDNDGSSDCGDDLIPKAILQIEIDENPGGVYTGLSRRECYALAYNTLRDAQAQHDRNQKTDQSDPKTPDIYLGKHRYRNVPRDNPRIFPPLAADDRYTKPRNKTSVPNFETVPPPTIRKWYQSNFEKVAESENWDVACQARLHVKIKKSLLGQSDDILEELWSRDTAVFDPNNAEYVNLKKDFEKKEDKRPMYGVMREMLMRHYMSKEAVDDLLKDLKKFKVKEPAVGEKRKKDSDDESSDEDSVESDPENDGHKDKRAKHSKGGPEGGSGGGASGSKAGGNGGSASKKTKPQDFQTIANEDIDFSSMKVGQVWLWRQNVAERSCPALDFMDSKMPIERVRARLHRAFNGEFTQENVDKDTAPIWRERLGIENTLGYDGILSALNAGTYDVPRLPKELKWYPDYYLLKRNITPAKKRKEGEGSEGNDGFGGENGPAGLLDFRTMDPARLEKYMTKEMRNDPRYKNVRLRGYPVEPNRVSMRAMCYVDRRGNRFGDESDYTLERLWYDDSLVFTENQRRFRTLKARAIRERMAAHYHSDDPLESSGSYGEDGTETSTETTTEENTPEGSVQGTSEQDTSPHEPPTEAHQSLTSTSDTIGSKRKHDGDSNLTGKKLKMPEFEDDKSEKAEDANDDELEDDDQKNIFPDDLGETGDEPGWDGAFVSSSSELPSSSENTGD